MEQQRAEIEKRGPLRSAVADGRGGLPIKEFLVIWKNRWLLGGKKTRVYLPLHFTADCPLFPGKKTRNKMSA